jgi:hypothetical protein
MSAKRKTTLLLAALGFGITSIIWAYSFSSRTFSLPLWTAFVVLCPPSLLSIPLIDVEPGSAGFTTMWAIIGLLNAALYAIIGNIFCSWWLNRSSRPPTDD